MNKKDKKPDDGTGCLIFGILIGLFFIWLDLASSAKRDPYLSPADSGGLALIGGLCVIGSSIFLILIWSDKLKQARLAEPKSGSSKQEFVNSSPSHPQPMQIPVLATIARVGRTPSDASNPRFLVFDLETAKVLPEGATDFRTFHPLGITCAATLDETGMLRLWHGKDNSGRPTAKMTKAEAGSLLGFLLEQQANGRCVVTWNGAAFDFHVIGEEADDLDGGAQIAKNHVDLMLAFVSVKGHRLALKTAAEACGSHKGSADIDSGSEIPKLWSQGEYARCLEYVKQDVHAIAQVTRHLLIYKGFAWKSKRGISQNFSLPSWVHGLSDMTVAEVLGWPEPDTSWMNDPPRREDFLAWTEGLCDERSQHSIGTPASADSAVISSGGETVEPDFTREEVAALIAAGGVIDLSGMNLAGLDLSGLNLEDADFEQADLTNANLSGANLRSANMAHSTLSDAKLCGANLSDADLSKAFLDGTNLDKATLVRANLTEAKFGYARAIQANLRDAVLREASIFTTDLEEANLENAVLEGADLTYVWLEGANLRGACLDGGHFQDLDLEGADLSDCSLVETGWIYCNLQGANLSRARLNSANFYMHCNLNDAILVQAQMQQVTIDSASMRQVNLRAVDLSDCRLLFNTLTGAILADTCLKRAGLTLCILEGADLSGADLHSARLLGVSLAGTNLRGAVLLNVDLIGVGLSGVTYDNKTQWPDGFVPPQATDQ